MRRAKRELTIPQFINGLKARQSLKWHDYQRTMQMEVGRITASIREFVANKTPPTPAQLRAIERRVNSIGAMGDLVMEDMFRHGGFFEDGFGLGHETKDIVMVLNRECRKLDRAFGTKLESKIWENADSRRARVNAILKTIR